MPRTLISFEVGFTTLTLCIFLFFAYHVLVGIYNITFHPLTGVPGYRLAGATKLYQTYWCYSPNGSIYYRKVHEMHKKHGPIVRIAPNEVSLSDGDDFERIYNVRTRFTKDLGFYNAMGVFHGMFGAGDNERHRQLRAPWAGYFSTAAVDGLDGLIRSKVDLLCGKAELELRETGVLPIQGLFHALMIDIISAYTLPEGTKLLESRPYGDSYASNMFEGAVGIWLKMSSPVLGWLLQHIVAYLCRNGYRYDEFFNLFRVRPYPAF